MYLVRLLVFCNLHIGHSTTHNKGHLKIVVRPTKAKWVSCNWFVGVLQTAQKPTHNTQQRPLKVFGRPATGKRNAVYWMLYFYRNILSHELQTHDNNPKELILLIEWKTTENGKIYGGLDKAPRQFAEKVYGFIK